MELRVPPALSGVAIVVPLQLDRKEDGNFVYFMELFRSYFMLLLGFGLQIFLLLSIWEVNFEAFPEYDSECASGLLKVQLPCVFLFEAAIFGNLLDDIDLVRLIYYAEGEIHSPRYYNVHSKPKHGAVFVDESKGRLGRLMKKFRLPPPPNMPTWNLKGMTPRYKLLCFFLVGVPKLLCTMTLSYLGGLFIVSRGTIDDIVLNALAVNFVLAVDNIMYTSFIAPGIKTCIDHMESVIVDIDSNQRYAQWLTSVLFYPLVTMFATFYIVVVSAGCGLHHFPDNVAHFIHTLKLPLLHPPFHISDSQY